MRRIAFTTAALILVMSWPILAQEWIQYASKVDSFGVNFPSEPRVQDITYPTEYGITLPGRVYRVENGQSRYSITVIDYARRRSHPHRKSRAVQEEWRRGRRLSKRLAG